MLAGALLILALGIQMADAAASQFHWGVASSGFQHEGYSPDSNWMRYVAADTTIVKPYLNSADFYHRYASDIALAKDMGVNTYRFSIEWARIEPKQGVLNQTELAFYDNLVSTVRAAAMTPMITLDHWVYPGWVYNQGGWTVGSTMTNWLAHANTIVSRNAGLGVMWITINEASEYMAKETSFGGLNPIQVAQMQYYMVQTHRQAYDLIHTLDPGALVSSSLAYEPPPLQVVNDAVFFDQITDKIDFIAIDYYYGLSLGDWSVVEAIHGDLWDIKPEPDGLYYALMSYHQKMPDLPFYIVENGFSTNNGSSVHAYSANYTRSDCLLDHVYWLQRAAADGLNVIGYNYWSMTDNYEWGTYQPRFGLYTVNVLTDPTLFRNATDAVATYKQIIANGGVPAGYIPVMSQSLCNAAAPISACLGQIVALIFPSTGSSTAPVLAIQSPSQSTQAPTSMTAAGSGDSARMSTVTLGAVASGVLGGIGLALVAAVRNRRRRRAEKQE